jgi:SAM-dependent methyltransferase
MSQSDGGQRAYWNGPNTQTWAHEHERIDARFAPLGEALLDFAAPRSGERVLDIGCATGTTLLALAGTVGPGGRALGADIAEASVAVARTRIAAAGLPQAEAILADAGSHPFPAGGFDLLFSRFGMMFFEDPVPAFANLRRALVPGGRVAMLAWRPAAENPWATIPALAVRHLVPPAAPPGPEEPGQFAFGDPARVRRILEGAGFRDVALTPLDRPLTLGADAAEATAFSLTLGGVVRALATVPQAARPAVREAARAALQDCFRPHAGPAGVVLDSGTWLISARP